MKAEEFFIKEWGTGFHDATLSSDKGLLQMSMQDVYETMEKYREKAEKKQASIYYSGYNRGHKDARNGQHISNVHLAYKDYKSKKE